MHPPRLPAPSPAFATRKAAVLAQLDVPVSAYADASPKGSVDEGIRGLLGEVNAADGLVTTSSCAGRVSVFLEGRRTRDGGDEDAGRAGGEVAGVGGKGAGGTWLFVSHDPVREGDEAWMECLGLGEGGDDGQLGVQAGRERRLIHFKFEPMILHVFTTSPSHAQLLLRCALQAGFRESGAVNLTPPTPAPSSTADDVATPMVAVRSMGLGFESLIGLETGGGQRVGLVPAAYLRLLMGVANERFAENAKRIARFREALRQALAGPPVRSSAEGGVWEDAAARRERKRAEGLMRQAELAKNVRETSASD